MLGVVGPCPDISMHDVVFKKYEKGMKYSPGGKAMMCLNLNATVTRDQVRVEGLGSLMSKISQIPTPRIFAYGIRKSP